MLDFASALYLGLRHASGDLAPWDALTTGVPAALAEPAEASEVACGLARLQGCDRAVLAPSTLHAFWDLGGAFAADYAVAFMDQGAYATARWGIARMAASGLRVRTFRHHDPDALRHGLAGVRGRPLVIADGFCPRCGSSVPITEYLDLTQERGGTLVLDDTQALGILGRAPSLDRPYGCGGGGTLAWSGCRSAAVMLVSSLAKAFGVPLTVVAGNQAAVERFVRLSDTRVHCSPPAMSALRAARRALAINVTRGDRLRRRLAANVLRFRSRLVEAGFAAIGGAFPVQTILLPPDADAGRVHDDLERAGIRTVLRRGGRTGGPLLTFIVNAQHAPRDLDRATEQLSSIVTPPRRVAREVRSHDA